MDGTLFTRPFLDFFIEEGLACEIAFILLARQMVISSHSCPCYPMHGTLAFCSYHCFLVVAFVLPQASILPLCSIDSTTFIPTEGRDSNTLNIIWFSSKFFRTSV